MTTILKVSEIQDPTNGNTAMTIDTSGRVSQSQIIAFMATTTSASTAVDAIVSTWQTPTVNKGSAFNSGTGKFVAPAAGVYHFAATILGGAHNSSNTEVWVYKNTTVVVKARDDTQNGRYQTFTPTATLDLAANDEVYLKNKGTGTLPGHSNTGEPWVTFNGFRVG